MQFDHLKRRDLSRCSAGRQHCGRSRRARSKGAFDERPLVGLIQAALAFLYFAGGYFKAFKFDELASQFTALSRGGWRALGVLEMLGAVLLIVPAARNGCRS